MSSEDDPLLAALAALPSPALPEARAESIRLHARALLEPASPQPASVASRALLPLAFAAYAIVYLGWTVGMVTQNAREGSGSERS